MITESTEGTTRTRQRANPCRVTVTGGEGGFEVSRDDLLLKAALEQGIDYPHNCRVGVCGSCKTRLVRGRVSPMVDLALSPLSQAQLKEGYFLACQAKVRTDIEVEVRMGRRSVTPVTTVSSRVVLWRRLSHDVLELRLALDTPLHFHAGQYATIAKSGSFTRRHYSICDVPPEGGMPATEIGFLIRRLPGGRFSEWVFAQDRTGTRMWVEGPFGTMEVDDPDRDALCIAGGTGIAPILSIVGDRLRRCATSRITIVFGARTAEDRFAGAHLLRLALGSGGRLRVVTILSHEPPESSWNGPRGRVTDALTPELDIDFENVASFTCGNLDMVNAVEARLLSLGVVPARMHADRFVPSGPGR